MSLNKLCQLAGACVLLLASSLAVFGQGNLTGSISGTVVDPTNKSIPGATVSLRSELTNYARDVKTSGEGTFVIPDLVAGAYSVSISAPGFKTSVQKDINLGSTEQLSLHTIALQVGDVTSSVTVTAEVVHINTESFDRTAKVTEDQVENLPLTINHISGYTDLLKTVPGFIGGTYAGGQSGVTVTMMNGITAQNTGYTPLGTGTPQGIATNMDSIGEITVAVNSYLAEYGTRAGGSVIISTKNGTKVFHGTLYYYGRNEKLNSNSFSNNAHDANPTGCPIVNTGCINHAGRSRYRYEEPGGTIGGPVVIPGVRFNKNRDKLFFFYSYDQLIQVQSTGVLHLMMPTTRQLMGDFSQTFNPGTSTQTPLYQPSNGTGTAVQYSGNILPPSLNQLLNPVANNGLAQMLTMFPAPNAFPSQGNDPTNTYNYQADVTPSTPTRQHIFRIDYNVNPKTLLYGTFTESRQQTVDPNTTGFSFPSVTETTGTYALAPTFSMVRTIKSNLINELTVGYHTSCECNYYGSDIANWTRQSPKGGIEQSPGLVTGSWPTFSTINLPQLNPQLNPLGLVPIISGLIASPPAGSVGSPGTNISWDGRFPFHLRGTQMTLSDNISWIKGTHNMKFGFYDETTQRNAERNSTFTGSFNVGSPSGAIQALMPNDTGIGIANALTGQFQSYQESSGHLDSYGRYKRIEFFAQDTWKVSRKLSLDIGSRFAYIIPTYNAGEATVNYDQAVYNASAAQLPVLVTYACPAGGNNCGSAARPYNPVTGQFLANNSALVGTFANNAAGVPGTITGAAANISAGSVVDGTVCPMGASAKTGCKSANGVVYGNRFAVEPSIGFAYDVFGDGKTSMRGGFGIRYDQPGGGDDTVLAAAAEPPIQYTPQFNYGSVPSLFGGALTSVFAPTVTGSQAGISGVATESYDPHYKLAGAYNFSFGIQRDLGKGIVLDLSYVAALGRHELVNYSIDATPYGSLIATSSTNPTGYAACDPSRSAKGTTPILAFGQTSSCTALSNQFLVPVSAYNNIGYTTYNGTSSYNSMVLKIDRRFSRSLQLGGFWTWSKAMDDYAGNAVSSLSPNPVILNQVGGRKEITGLGNGDHTHNVTVNWIYALPSTSHLIGKNLASKVLDGWKINGFSTFQLGSPATFSYSQYINGNSGGTMNFSNCINCVPISYVNLTGPLNATPDQLTAQAANSSTGKTFFTQGPWNLNSIAPGTLAQFGVGNTGRTTFRNPGTEQIDLALVKDFRVDRHESHIMEFRVDMFNFLNHTNPGALSAAAQYSSGGQLLNGYNNGTATTPATGTFGTYGLSGGAAGGGFNRIMVAELRFRF